MVRSKTKNSIRSITTTAMLLAVLVAQEQVLVFIPQFQFTFLLILVFAQFLSYREIVPLVIAYVLLDNLVMGSFNVIYSLPPMISIPIFAIISRMLRHKPDFVSFIWIIMFSFIYSWAYIPANMLMQSNFNAWAYFIIDIPWEIALAFANILVFLLLYKPMTELFKMYYNKTDKLIY